MLKIFELTGNKKYLKWARQLCFKRIIDPLAAGDGSFITGYHANCSIPVYTGAERIYQHTADSHLHDAAVNFLNEVIDHRSWVIGGNSANEHFFPPDKFEEALHAKAGPESCNSVNMLRLIEAVYDRDPQPKYLDHYERILWNHLLAVHEPERCTVNYYVPMQPGTYRVYSDEFDSMWCCVGTGIECPGKYGRMIYTRGPDGHGVDVNLFVASRLNWQDGGLSLRQETSFPLEGSTSLSFDDATGEAMRLRIRHPWWIPAGKMIVKVNGNPLPASSGPGEYAVIDRAWRSGDRVDVDLPMKISTEALPASGQYFAILYGPIVLSGALGRTELTKLKFWEIKTTVPDIVPPEDQFPELTVAADRLPGAIIRTSSDDLRFEMRGATTIAENVELVPFYKNHFQRYAIYWKMA